MFFGIMPISILRLKVIGLYIHLIGTHVGGYSLGTLIIARSSKEFYVLDSWLSHLGLCLKE